MINFLYLLLVRQITDVEAFAWHHISMYLCLVAQPRSEAAQGICAAPFVYFSGMHAASSAR